MAFAAAGLASFALCFSGLAGLCLAMERHHRQVWHRSSSAARSRTLRAGGWALLALSLTACIRAWGAGTGVVVWFGLLTAASALIVVLLPYAPRAFAKCATLAVPVGVLFMIGQ